MQQKGAHAVLMYRMQDGVLDWRDLEKIKKIRQTYACSVVTIRAIAMPRGGMRVL